MKIYNFWDNTIIKNIMFDISKETNYKYSEVEKVIKYTMLSIKQEIANPISFKKILIHNFGSFTPRLILFNKVIKDNWKMYRKKNNESQNSLLYLKLKKLFLMRKIFINS